MDERGGSGRGAEERGRQLLSDAAQGPSPTPQSHSRPPEPGPSQASPSTSAGLSPLPKAAGASSAQPVPGQGPSQSAPAHISASAQAGGPSASRCEPRPPPPAQPPGPAPAHPPSVSLPDQHRRRSGNISNIGLHWMRVNGAFQQFRNLLSSARPSGSSPEAGRADVRSNGPRAALAATDSQDPAIALINLESGSYPNYTTEGPGGGEAAERGSGGGGAQRSIVSSRLVRRKELYEKRKLASDYALFFALLGIFLMIVENELSAAGSYSKASVYSYVLKTLVLCATLVLVALIGCFHVLEVQLFMNDNSAEDWRIAMTWRRMAQIGLELGICAVCPVPGDFRFSWTTVHADGETVTTTEVPVDVLLSIPMFARLYLIGRVMLLHSRLFTDASSRSIGALNRVHFNARFVLKTLMTLCPGTVLLVFTASLWVIAGWVLRLCERYHTGDPPNVQALKHQNYLNSLWMIAITFLSVGYGDIVPNTYCGRAVAVITGIMGAGTASMVVAVIAKKLELSRAEKHVHNFMIDTQLSKRLKHAAANVLRETWLIYKHRRLVEKLNPSRIRLHQRNFLCAIYELRKVKRDQRKLAENSMTVADIVKTAGSTMEMVSDLHSWQEGMEGRLVALETNVAAIRGDVSAILAAVSALGPSASAPGLRHRPSPKSSPSPD